MFKTPWYLCAALVAAFVVGCGGPEPKKIPEPTPEQKAEQQKAHEEMKAKMQQNTTPAEAPK